MPVRANLREELRSRGGSALLRADLLPRRRAAVLAWRERDGEAARLCAAAARFRALFRSCPLGDRPEADLRTCLETLAEERREGSILCPDGVYILWVWSRETPGGLDGLGAAFRDRLPVRAEQCRLTAERNSPGSGQGRLWLVDPGVPGGADTLAALLLAGSLDQPLISGAPGTPVRLRATPHSAVERDLARQLRDTLEALTREETCKERFREAFGPTDRDLEEVLAGVPRLRDLPITGGDGLAEVLNPPGERAARWFGRLFRREKTGTGTVTARTLLEELLGRPEGRPPQDWLLDRVMPVLPRLCRHYMERLELEARCYRQPLGLLTGQAAGLALYFQEQARAEQRERKGRLDEAMGRGVVLRGTHPAQLLAGLEQELTLWEACLRSGGEAAWWGEISRFFQAENSLMEQARAKQEELTRGLAVLSAMELGPRRQRAPMPGDWREATPSSILAGLYSQAEFTGEDATVLAEGARRRAEDAFRARGREETVLLWDGDSMDLLAQSRNAAGQPLFEERAGVLTARSNTGLVRVLPVRGLGRRLMWELRLSAPPEGWPDTAVRAAGPNQQIGDRREGG